MNYKDVPSRSRVQLSDALGFDPGPAYSRVMGGLRERILSKGRETYMIKYWAPKIFPEEFKELEEEVNLDE